MASSTHSDSNGALQKSKVVLSDSASLSEDDSEAFDSDWWSVKDNEDQLTMRAGQNLKQEVIHNCSCRPLRQDDTPKSHFPFDCCQLQTLSSFGRQVKADASTFDAVEIAIQILERAARFHRPPRCSVAKFVGGTYPTAVDYSKIDAKTCPKCMENPIFGQETCQIVSCNCGAIVCWICEMVSPCTNHVCITNDVDNIEQLVQGLVSCPKCRVVIERDSACPLHLQCTCGCTICWLCLDEKDGHHKCANDSRRKLNALRVLDFLDLTSVISLRRFCKLNQFLGLAEMHDHDAIDQDFVHTLSTTWHLLCWGGLYVRLMNCLAIHQPDPMAYLIEKRLVLLLRQALDIRNSKHACKLLQQSISSTIQLFVESSSSTR